MARSGHGTNEVKAAFLSASEVAPGLNMELLQSWQRSKDALGFPENIRDVPQVPVDSLDSHILDMFQAPLGRISEDLRDTGLGLLLADAKGQILQRWTHDRAASAHLDRLGTIRGAVLAEEAVGTNGVGSVAATGKSLQVVGAEHFADFYSNAVCTGSPVCHPASGKLLAVVTVSSDLSERSRLLRPLVGSVARQLEQQVLDFEGPAAHHVYEAFIEASRLESSPVIAFGPQGLVMQSRSAARLSPHDISLLDDACSGIRHQARFDLDLSIGTIGVRVEALDGGSGTVAVLDKERPPRTTAMGPARSQLVGRSPVWLQAAREVARYKEGRRPLIVAGEPGTGKTSLALGLPYRASSSSRLIVDAAARYVVGSREWLQSVAARLDTSAPVIIRGTDGLSESDLDGLRSILAKRTGHGSVLFVMPAARQKLVEETATRLEVDTVWVPPLRERISDLPLLWRLLSDQFAPGAGLTLGGDALELMSAYSWPANVKELRSVVQRMATAGKRGLVTPSDLPDSIRGSRGLSMIEQAEVDAIRKALAEADGNRSKAAKILGLSRATVYRKLRTYRLTA